MKNTSRRQDDSSFYSKVMVTIKTTLKIILYRNQIVLFIA